MDAAFNSLMAMRKAGKRPPGPIFVTDDYATARRAKQLGFFVLKIRVGSTYDWRVIRALGVILSTVAKRELIAPTARAIFDQDPRSMLWGNEDGDEWVIPCPR